MIARLSTQPDVTSSPRPGLIKFSRAVFTDGRPARVLVSTLNVPLPIERVFSFFSSAENLGVITPPWLKFRIVTPLPIAMRVGALIDYRISLRGFPMTWRSEITEWQPPFSFVDEQRKGPYLLWHHRHVFESVSLPGGGLGTRVIDRVHYRHLGGSLIHSTLVQPDLRRIFEYRHHTLGDLMARMS